MTKDRRLVPGLLRGADLEDLLQPKHISTAKKITHIKQKKIWVRKNKQLYEETNNIREIKDR